MHIILKNHISELAEDFQYDGIKDSKLFELFSNYCVISKHFFGRFDPKSVTTDEDDASIDGLAIIVDGDLITTEDDAIEVFKTHKTNLAVDLVFVQSKSGESFTKEDINNFKVGLEDFLSLDPVLPNGKLNTELLAVFNIVLKNLKKVRNRRPNAYIYYCTSGTYKAEREIKASFEIINRCVKESEFFHAVSVTAVGRSEMLKYYVNLTEKNEAKLKLIDFFGMPAMPGIPQSYVALVNAKEFVNSLLIDEDNNLKHYVFEENVRSFLGAENEVNQDIQKTLQDVNKKSLFSVLNNGITIVAPELTLTPNTKELNITNYQIINGCQTSTTLFENKSFLDESSNVVVKFIESPDNESSSDIIAATNSQSNIPQESFFGLKNKAKLVQKYFQVQNQSCPAENNIYFERRQGEFKGVGYQSSRIFDVREIARCYAAMFLNTPHNSARYVKTIFSANGDNLFKEEDHEAYYYASALALYKYQALINGRKIDAQNYVKLRWHIIQGFKLLCHNSMDVPLAGSKKAEKYASKIIDVLNSEKRSYVNIFEKCQHIIDSLGFPTDDEIKRGKFTQELMIAVENEINRKKTRDLESSVV
ncbi:AIPR family protein [Deefgea piscis]|uniref:AIPR family protein n=1 Tax=Deefgea piscis TaxID=2739061 RepID=UPI001C7FE897|nr:AIPR family protein [Deefgea piscis]QZA81378.1 AIPR family protein [Deefgea piscis]